MNYRLLKRSLNKKKNADNYKNRIPYPTEQKPIEVIDLTNVIGEEQPETFENRTSILPDEKFVQEKQKKYIQKKSCKKKWKERKSEKTVTAKHWKNECNQKAKTINFCRIVSFLYKIFFLEIRHIFENNMPYVSLPFGLIQKDKQIKLDLPKNYAASQ